MDPAPHNTAACTPRELGIGVDLNAIIDAYWPTTGAVALPQA